MLGGSRRSFPVAARGSDAGLFQVVEFLLYSLLVSLRGRLAYLIHLFGWLICAVLCWLFRYDGSSSSDGAASLGARVWVLIEQRLFSRSAVTVVTFVFISYLAPMEVARDCNCPASSRSRPAQQDLLCWWRCTATLYPWWWFQKVLLWLIQGETSCGEDSRWFGFPISLVSAHGFNFHYLLATIFQLWHVKFNLSFVCLPFDYVGNLVVF